MKIVHITRQYAPAIGGLEEVVQQLARAQLSNGHDVRIVTLDRLFTQRDARLPHEEQRDGLSITRLPFAGSTRYPLAPSVLGALGDAEIVHVHAVDFFFDFLALTQAWHRKILIATTHGGFFHTDAQAGLKKLWFNSVTRLTAKGYASIAACSDSDRAMFAAIAPSKTCLVENGVDITKFADCASRMPQKRIVTIGRFSDNKRLDRLLDALAVLVARNADWQLDIIGMESDWTRAQLLHAIAARKLDAYAHVHVGLDIPGMAAQIGQASLFASASTHEGFGLALIEAASAGLACVVEANAAFRSLAPRIHGVTLTDFFQPQIAANALVSAFDTLSQNSAAVRAATIKDANAFAWPQVAAQYEQLYRDALG